MQGRITDEAGRRVDGAKIGVWFQGTAILDEASAKDGSYHLRLRAGPLELRRSASATPGWPPTSPTCASTGRARSSETFASPPRTLIRGRVVGNKGEPIRGVAVYAVRNPDDPIASGEAQTGEDGTFAVGGLDARRYTCARRSSAGCPRRSSGP